MLMRLRILCLILMTGFVGLDFDASPARGQVTTVTFRERATVSGEMVHLGDIADITGAAPEQTLSWQSAVVAPAPLAGSGTRLLFANVRSRLAALGLPVATASFGGRSVVEVHRIDNSAAGTIRQASGTTSDHATTTELRQARSLLEQAVRKDLATRVDPAAIRSLDPGLQTGDIPSFLQTANRNTEFHIHGWDETKQNLQQLTADYLTTTGESRRISFDCRFHWNPQVPVARHPLRRGDIVQVQDLQWGYTTTDKILTNTDDIIGQEVLGSVAGGDPFTEKSLKKVPLVKRRDQVTVVSQSGRIVVSRTMSAVSEGALGDSISVVDLVTKEKLAAIVTGYHTAEVLESYTARIHNEARTGIAAASRQPRTPARIAPLASGPLTSGPLTGVKFIKQRAALPDGESRSMYDRQRDSR